MNSLVLRTATKFLTTLLLVFAVFLLVRGHNAPGGGFVAGLVAATAVVLYAVGFGGPAARSLIRVSPRHLIGGGLFVAIISAIVSFGFGDAFLTGQWGEWNPTDRVAIKLGTPLLFDLGVFLVVLGVSVGIIMDLTED